MNYRDPPCPPKLPEICFDETAELHMRRRAAFSAYKVPGGIKQLAELDAFDKCFLPKKKTMGKNPNKLYSLKYHWPMI